MSETNVLKALYVQEVETKWFQRGVKLDVNLMSTCTAFTAAAPPPPPRFVLFREIAKHAEAQWRSKAQKNNKGFKLKAMLSFFSIKI